ncbi:hypothetical protein GGS21DRAFT_234186 [Xylaria nigripes]|nr:hypothetical protein GGS21DRAFT_234186 [Xylaria nigripes]
MSGMTSTGRGGAGNITAATKSPPITAADLETPTLKTSMVTTGRGGSGNMAQNLDPVETRARQDVGLVELGPSIGAIHVGRGGAANVVKPPSPEPKSDAREGEPAVADASTAAAAADTTTIATTPPAATAAAPDAKKDPQLGKADGDKEKDRGLAKKAKDFFKLT